MPTYSEKKYISKKRASQAIKSSLLYLQVIIYAENPKEFPFHPLPHHLQSVHFPNVSHANTLFMLVINRERLVVEFVHAGDFLAPKLYLIEKANGLFYI